jgi:hypothetical protein
MNTVYLDRFVVGWNLMLIAFFVWDVTFHRDKPIWIHVVVNDHGRAVQVGNAFTFYFWQIVAHVGAIMSLHATNVFNAGVLARHAQMEEAIGTVMVLRSNIAYADERAKVAEQTAERLHDELARAKDKLQEVPSLRARIIDSDRARQQIVELQHRIDELEPLVLKKQELEAAQMTILTLQERNRGLEREVEFYRKYKVMVGDEEEEEYQDKSKDV